MADDPSFAVANSLFTLHWLYLENEVWLDSDSGWIAVVDDASQFGMVEEFSYLPGAEYPGHASVIFYKNGAALELGANGMPRMRSADPEQTPYYMEAELNSPMVALRPGESYAFETRWHPVRAGKNLTSVNWGGTVEHPLVASVSVDKLHLTGQFGIFYPCTLSAHLVEANGAERKIALGSADPLRLLQLDETITASPRTVRVALHLEDANGTDLGTLGMAELPARKGM